ncbi:MAG TPA: redoxin domain-containing protein, partial [Longimicrobiales bacterium]|nr:redoxin domain-containing protein [Longimicrobiales bacterium]
MALKPGDTAPDFELRSHRGGTVKLSDFIGRKNVVLAFHPLAFTPVCATQMTAYESDVRQFESSDTVVLGVSIDPQPAKTAWAKELG